MAPYCEIKFSNIFFSVFVTKLVDIVCMKKEKNEKKKKAMKKKRYLGENKKFNEHLWSLYNFMFHDKCVQKALKIVSRK